MGGPVFRNPRFCDFDSLNIEEVIQQETIFKSCKKNETLFEIPRNRLKQPISLEHDESECEN